eukprot:scaffold112370_cov42-Phaeocystis_antarctica.AAC.3
MGERSRGALTTDEMGMGPLYSGASATPQPRPRPVSATRPESSAHSNRAPRPGTAAARSGS